MVPESKEVLKDCWGPVKRNLLLTKLQEIPTSQSWQSLALPIILTSLQVWPTRFCVSSALGRVPCHLNVFLFKKERKFLNQALSSTLSRKMKNRGISEITQGTNQLNLECGKSYRINICFIQQENDMERRWTVLNFKTFEGT